MNDTMKFEIVGIEWGGFYAGKKTATAVVTVNTADVARCTTDMEVAVLAVKTLATQFGCPIAAIDTVRVAA